MLGFEQNPTLKYALEPFVIRKIVEIEAPDILVKDVEFFRKSYGQYLLGLELLVMDDVPCLCHRFSVQASPQEVSSDEIHNHILGT